MQDLRKRIDSIIRSTIRDAKDSDKEETELLITGASASILEAVVKDLPPAVDIAGKYETEPGAGVYIKLKERDEQTQLDDKMDLDQLNYLGDYAADEGYNKAVWITKKHFQSLYMAN